MDFAIISKESTAYDLQPLVCLWMFIFWKVYFNSLGLITGTHSAIGPPAFYPQQSTISTKMPFLQLGVRVKNTAGVMRDYSLKKWHAAAEGGMSEKNAAHHRIFGSRMLQALSKAVLWAIHCEWVSFASWMLTLLSAGDGTGESDVFLLPGQEMFLYFFWLKAIFTKPIKSRFSNFLLRAFSTTYRQYNFKLENSLPHIQTNYSLCIGTRIGSAKSYRNI